MSLEKLENTIEKIRDSGIVTTKSSDIATDILVEDLSLPTINDNGVNIIDGAA